jgi:hypothetical protein
MTSVIDKFLELANPRFEVEAIPQQVPLLVHDLSDSKSNLKFFDWLSSQKGKALGTFEKGSLRLYDTAVIYLREQDTSFPVKFIYMFNHIKFKNHAAIQEKFIWRDPDLKLKINNMPITSYCLFEVLIPTFGIVISADEHTIGGEKLTRKNIELALAAKLFVYLTDEKGQIYAIETFEQIELNRDLIWGEDSFFKKRLIVYSATDLLKEQVISALKKVVASTYTPES